MRTKLCLLLLVLSFSFACAQNKSTDVQVVKKGMIKITILYPNGEGKTFDMDYYIKTHMPLVKRLCGDPLKVITIDKGLSGGAPDSPAPYLAIGYLYFETLSAYQNAMAPNRDEIRTDIPKFTNIQPVIQISEVMQ